MLTKLKPFLPYITAVFLAGGMFLVGRWTSNSSDDKELIRRLELERKFHLDQITEKDGKINDMTKAGLTIREKMYQDSVKTSIALKSNNEAYLVLLKKYEKINYSRASTSELDSVRARLLTLYSNRGK